MFAFQSCCVVAPGGKMIQELNDSNKNTENWGNYICGTASLNLVSSTLSNWIRSSPDVYLPTD